nr:hypothetical protein [Yoonia sp.]
MKNTFPIAALCSIIAVSATAFTDEFRTLANEPSMVSASNKFASSLEPLIFSDCFHTYQAAASLYFINMATGNYQPTEDVFQYLLQLQVIFNGVEIYLSDFTKQYKTYQPLLEVLYATSGDYAIANKDAMRRRCITQFVLANQP